jgi:hypothetical protein
MTTAAPSTALATIQPAFTDAGARASSAGPDLGQEIKKVVAACSRDRRK